MPKTPAEPQSFYFFGDAFGFTTREGVVRSVQAGGQAQEKGIRKGWRVAAIDDEAVPEDIDDSELDRRLKTAVARGGDCVQITFQPSKHKAKAKKEVNPEKVLKTQDALRDASVLSTEQGKEQRKENLKALAVLSRDEATEVLQDQKVVQNLLNHRCADELSLLLKEKTAEQLEGTLRVHERLQGGGAPTVEEARKVDLGHKDAKGNTALHMARTTKSFARLLGVEEGSAGKRSRRPTVMKSLFQVRNGDGETPMQTALRLNADTGELMGFLSDIVPEVVREELCEVVHLVPRADRAQLFKPKLEWPQVRDVLLSGDASAILDGYSSLAKEVRASSTDLLAEDHAGTWSELLAEHCFGVLRSDEKGRLGHCEASHERLGCVWAALRQLLVACANSSLPKEEGERLKDVTKGLLIATKGPSKSNFDPREPYREEFISSIRELQSKTATTLESALQASVAKEVAAAEEIRRLPRDELRGVDTSSAKARGASARLRMDSPLLADPLREGGGGGTGDSLDAPGWVFEQSLEPRLFEELKRWGCVQRASDIVDIAKGATEGVSSSVQKVLKEERLRFCRLHAAWMRGICSQHLAAVSARIRSAVGLPDKGEEPPWEAGGGSKVALFRTRAEAKGLTRILEKMNEALAEEVAQGNTQSILRQYSLGKSSGIEDSEDPEAGAVRALLTPACFIVDVAGAEVVVESFGDMAALSRHLFGQSLQKHGCQVVRIKNGFSGELSAAEVGAKGGYRDLKLWLMVLSSGVRLVAELQVHLRCFHELKRVMHLPYECSRGSFEHPHLAGLWKARERSGKCCGCALA